MSRLGEIFKAGPELLQGATPDLHPSLGGLWEKAFNVRFTLSGIEPLGGWVADMGANPRLLSLRGGGWGLVAGQMVGIVGNWQALYRITVGLNSHAPTLTVLDTGLTGARYQNGSTPATVWSYATWGTQFVCANGKDTIAVYTGTLTPLSLPGGAIPRIVLTQGAHVLAFNWGAGAGAPNRFGWCSADAVTVWTTAPNNTAGDLDIREFAEGIIAAVPLGERIAVYSSNQLAIVSYIGAPLIYGYKVTIAEGVGAVSPFSVHAVGSRNYGLSAQGFFVTDGLTTSPLGLGAVWATFSEEMNWAQASLVHGYHLVKETELWWWYPTGTSTEPNKAIVYNYVTKAWYFCDQARSGSIPPGDLSNPIAFSPAGEIYFHEEGTAVVRSDYVGGPLVSSAIPVLLETKVLPWVHQTAEGSYSTWDRYKYVHKLLAQMKGYRDVGLVVAIGVQDELEDGTVYWSAPYEVDNVYPLVTGRFLRIRIENLGSTSAWSLQGLSLQGKVTGYVR